MVSQETLARKISYIVSKLERLKNLGRPSKNKFFNSQDLQDMVLHNLQLAIQACIDIGVHIITDEGWGTPGSFSDVFYKLEEREVINRELNEQLVRMVGFRNRIIHDYEEIDLNIVYEVWQYGIKDIESYILQVGDYFNI